ncbi:MAG: hypothetical protein AAFR68_04170 [Pseudomonadota bacterium]
MPGTIVRVGEIFLGTLTCIVLFAAMSHAQSNCADREVVRDRLTERYEESFVGAGLRGVGAIFEVWASDEHGTWTIIKTLPSGKSCVMAAGTDWRTDPPKKPVH